MLKHHTDSITQQGGRNVTLSCFWRIPMNWFDGFIETAKNIIRQGDELAPMLFLKKGKHLEAIGLGSLLADKEAMSLAIRSLIAQRNPAEYLLLMESWIMVADPHDQANTSLNELVANGTLQISQLPSKKECMTLLHGTRETERLGTIIFNGHGKEATFEALTWAPEGELAGRFIGLRSRKP